MRLGVTPRRSTSPTTTRNGAPRCTATTRSTSGWCLEAFQSGLSWLTILRKRPAFRAAFHGFSIPAVAAFGPDDEERLMADAGIVRNRAKIAATIANASAAAADLDERPGRTAVVVRTHGSARPAADHGDVPATSPESVAMAKDLKRRGFAFVGPTTAYAMMQATGMVDDHVATCFRARLVGRPRPG